MFPLPLTAIEHYMLADDSADYPRLFWLVVQLRIRLEESRLRRAIEGAVERHPLLGAVVEFEGDQPRRWVACREPQYSVRWLDAECDAQRIVEPIDLHCGPGVRFSVERSGDADTLTVGFHHAAADGIGAMQFVRDLLALYDADARGSRPVLPGLDATRLATRDSFGLSGWRRPLRWIYGTFGWLGAIEYLVHHPAPLGKTPNAIDSGGRCGGFCSRVLSEEETRTLVDAAKRDGVTVNDRLVRDVFVAVQAFIERHAPERRREHKRIMVPTNLRTADDDGLPAANVVAMVHIDRRPHRWPDRSQMLRALHRELMVVRRLRLGISFVLILGTLQRLFGSLRRFLPTDRCQATCVVSNLGVVPDFCNDVVQGVEFYPPIRPFTSAAFGVATSGRRLSVSLHYDAAMLSAAEGEELLGLLTNGLRRPSCSEPVRRLNDEHAVAAN